MEKKAEAYAKYNKAAVAEMMIKVLPDVAAKIAEPLGQIDKNYDYRWRWWQQWC